jgi:KipI family sensor histidine kinase inhibitor
VDSFSIDPVGDAALLVTLGDTIALAINRRVHALANLLMGEGITGLGECVPAYVSVLVHYDPLLLTYDRLIDLIESRLEGLVIDAQWQPRVIEVPVVYGGESGPDLDFVSGHSDLTQAEVIALHSAGEYPVYMMGFTPGFPYLGGMDRRLACPRLETPRTRIPAGSVGIAGEQTGIYPLESPGGWRIIGRTPLRLFDLQREPPCLLAPGDVVRFVSIERMPDDTEGPDGPLGS